jgi:hypothetical protein
MFDLQALAFMTDMTRIFSFKMGRDGRDGSIRRRVSTAFHPPPIHRDQEKRIEEFAKINQYHVSSSPTSREAEVDEEGEPTSWRRPSRLRFAIRSERPQPQALSVVPSGHANGRSKATLHVKTADGTPMANAMLTVLRRLGSTIPRASATAPAGDQI